MSTSVYNNGGMLGVTLDFGATDFYQTSSTVQNDSFTIEATATAADADSDEGGVTIPAGVQDGDLLVVACGHTSTPISEANMASGWTVLANSDDNSDGSPSVQSVILYKIATSSDAGTTFILTTSVTVSIDYKMFVLRPDDAAIAAGTTFTTGEDSYKTFNNPPQLSVNPSGSSGPVFAIAAYAVNTGSQPSASPTPTGNDAVDGTNFYVSHWVYSRADTKPSSITWDATDGGRNAVSLAYIEIPDSVSLVNQNKKNSGIWNLEAVYNELSAPITLSTDSLSSWTVSDTADVRIDASNGNPGNCIETDGGGYAYIDTGITNWNNKKISFDVYIKSGTYQLGNFYFACNSSGSGQHARLDARVTQQCGFSSTTSWTVWADEATGGNTGAGDWRPVEIEINGSGQASLKISGFTFQSGYSITNNGGYVSVHGDSSVVSGCRFDNIVITNL